MGCAIPNTAVGRENCAELTFRARTASSSGRQAVSRASERVRTTSAAGKVGPAASTPVMSVHRLVAFGWLQCGRDRQLRGRLPPAPTAASRSSMTGVRWTATGSCPGARTAPSKVGCGETVSDHRRWLAAVPMGPSSAAFVPPALRSKHRCDRRRECSALQQPSSKHAPMLLRRP